MQLISPTPAALTRTLGLLTASLFAATGLHAQDVSPAASHSAYGPSPDARTPTSDTSSDLGLTRVDTAILFYQEAGGRVKATEPVTSITFNGSDGEILSVKLTADSLTGATPNGAAPWKATQTFISPSKSKGVQTTTTSASGHSQTVTLPGTDIVASQYTADPHALPLDYGFRDTRYAVDLGYTTPIDAVTRLSFGGGLSTERDFKSLSGSFGLARDLFDKNTTVSAAVNLEYDTSNPYFGTPQPLTEMSALEKGPNQSKTVVNAVLGVTQVMNRNWLAQVNYSVGSANGYQTDPYRLISVVDGTTGAPVRYLYESRPKSRIRQSLYMGNKIALGPTVTDISGRLYHDSWGINSVTAEIAERVAITSALYVEPHLRYYSQSKANFFHDYLIDGQTLPDYASSDSRLGKFTATTVGLKVGLKVTTNGELYVRADSYNQTGAAHPATAIGDLKTENLFSGIKATSVIVGYTFAFQ
ncbi:hypothetical protein AEAC466_05865 [Asticcacaulis sp. AC466]|uniref:DUF3570 domain-containing protein n=1 Tax=Asticcacaulis sp. AC466 TaxID=1282362 RepID=UPI0003C3C588|nr:DUF3570 domain-containing protein [Asticcacaulis sp. AC466]ESQ85236.1 hypothetical protein AEAC466_05865 [Asticcacaulis sp. AC466]